MRLTHLDRLEADSIHILREAAAAAARPVMLYSAGKDSAVLLHLARKAFHPAPLPFPLLHIDTQWKFAEMIAMREQVAQQAGVRMLVHVNADGAARGISPLTSGSALHTEVMKTQALRQALDRHGFDMAIGGARRDEEASRAKERVFSLRTSGHRWDPRRQRPEPWALYNTHVAPGESLRVFPLSDWTEIDVWEYIAREAIAIVGLYFAAERDVVERDGALIVRDDDRLPLHPGETVQRRMVRFRSLGCYPLTAAIPSQARSVADIIAELRGARHSERQGRVIDHDSGASMEARKREGYF